MTSGEFHLPFSFIQKDARFNYPRIARVPETSGEPEFLVIAHELMLCSTGLWGGHSDVVYGSRLSPSDVSDWSSLIPRPKEAEEEKGFDFSCSRMCMIISYLSTCMCGWAREKTFWLSHGFITDVYCCARITMSVINACHTCMCRDSVKGKSVLHCSALEWYSMNWQTELYIYWECQ